MRMVREAKILEVAISLVISLLVANLYAEVNIAIIDSGSREKVDAAISFTSIPANIDPINHGTKLTTIIKNLNPQAKIYMLQVCEKTGQSYLPSSESILRAIKWCEENNVDIVNLSLVINYNKEIEEAIRQAHDNKGIIFIAAAGNNSMINRFTVNSNGFIAYVAEKKNQMFPASSDYVISVGSKDEYKKTSADSNQAVTVFENGYYGKQSGTSFACARVTAKASKILTLNPNISLKQLIQSLE